MDDDFLTMADSFRDDNLDEALNEFLSRAEREIQNLDLKTEIYRYISVENRGVSTDQRNLPNLPSSLVQLASDMQGWEETKKLESVIQDTFGIQFVNYSQRQLIVEVFGRHAERLGRYEHFPIRYIRNKIALESIGKSWIHCSLLLDGVECDIPLIVEKNVSLVERDENLLTHLETVQFPDVETPKTQLARSSASIEYSVQREPGDDPDHIRAIAVRERLIQYFSLYFGNNSRYLLHRIRRDRYSAEGTIGPLPILGDVEPPSREVKNVRPLDVRRIGNLSTILGPLYKMEDQSFGFPIGMALDHLNTSLQNHKNWHSSITFAVIGLESIFKKCIKGESMSNKDVARYAGLLLGIASKRFDAKKVKSEITSAYGTRNEWVHGGSPGKQNSDDHQKELWDYLRCSIILFSFLKSQEYIGINRPLEIDDALIDPDERENLERKLSNFRFLDYLYLGRTI